jgi:hypothetical protein
LASSKRAIWIVASALIAMIAVGAVVWQRRQVPEPGTETYEQTTRAFYHGLAALEVGLAWRAGRSRRADSARAVTRT